MKELEVKWVITVLLGCEYDCYSFLFFIIPAFFRIWKELLLNINVAKEGKKEEGQKVRVKKTSICKLWHQVILQQLVWEAWWALHFRMGQGEFPHLLVHTSLVLVGGVACVWP